MNLILKLVPYQIIRAQRSLCKIAKHIQPRDVDISSATGTTDLSSDLILGIRLGFFECISEILSFEYSKLFPLHHNHHNY